MTARALPAVPVSYLRTVVWLQNKQQSARPDGAPDDGGTQAVATGHDRLLDNRSLPDGLIVGGRVRCLTIATSSGEEDADLFSDAVRVIEPGHVAGAVDEAQPSAGERVCDVLPALGRADGFVRGAVHVERRLSDGSELTIVEGQTGPVRLPFDDRADHVALVPHRVGLGFYAQAPVDELIWDAPVVEASSVPRLAQDRAQPGTVAGHADHQCARG